MCVATTARTDDLGGRPRTTSAEAHRQSARSRLKRPYSHVTRRIPMLSLHKGHVTADGASAVPINIVYINPSIWYTIVLNPAHFIYSTLQVNSPPYRYVRVLYGILYRINKQLPLSTIMSLVTRKFVYNAVRVQGRIGLYYIVYRLYLDYIISCSNFYKKLYSYHPASESICPKPLLSR